METVKRARDQTAHSVTNVDPVYNEAVCICHQRPSERQLGRFTPDLFFSQSKLNKYCSGRPANIC